MVTVGHSINVKKRFRCQRDTELLRMLHLTYSTHFNGQRLRWCSTVTHHLTISKLNFQDFNFVVQMTHFKYYIKNAAIKQALVSLN